MAVSNYQKEICDMIVSGDNCHEDNEIKISKNIK